MFFTLINLAFTATSIVETDMRIAPIAGERIIPTGSLPCKPCDLVVHILKLIIVICTGYHHLERDFEMKRSEKKASAELGKRDSVPIVVVVYHREEETRKMFKQLAKVTDNYSLIIVNNGFDDPDFLRGLKPVKLIENTENVGAIRAVNQGFDAAEGKYICVLHNDLLIYEDGWLDHIAYFLERRPDVGLVGLAGRHTIKEDGTYDNETTIVNMEGYLKSRIPTWRFTEVAAVDGLGWVMRNEGFRLEERYGHMHFYDLDLSLQYIEAGSKVYVVSIELYHMADLGGHSTRDDNQYLKAIGGDDEAYQESVREIFREKWQHVLPITRGFRDEAYAFNRVKELQEEIEEITTFANRLEKENKQAKEYMKQISEENDARGTELEKASEYARNLERICEVRLSELEKAKRKIEELKTGGKRGGRKAGA